MDPKADVVVLLEAEAERPGSVLSECGKAFDGLVVVLTRDEPGSTFVDDLARHAHYLDSVTDTQVLILLPWRPPPEVQPPPGSADVGTLYSTPRDFVQRRTDLLLRNGLNHRYGDEEPRAVQQRIADDVVGSVESIRKSNKNCFITLAAALAFEVAGIGTVGVIAAWILLSQLTT